MGSSVPYGAQSLTRHPANEERDDGAGGELEGLYFQSPSLVCGETEARRWEGDVCKRPQRDGVSQWLQAQGWGCLDSSGSIKLVRVPWALGGWNPLLAPSGCRNGVPSVKTGAPR